MNDDNISDDMSMEEGARVNQITQKDSRIDQFTSRNKEL